MKPFTNLDEALATLHQRTSSSRFGLRHFKQCVADLGNPQLQLKVVHVAGTNGKGSVSNYVATTLELANYKVGLYTSPFLITHNDRFRINHQPISDARLLHYINKSLLYWESYNISMFEIDTLIAFWYFIDEAVDWAVIEVGLGGRLDATNVVMPKVSVITTIGYDHMDILGDTLPEIAFEKAGIIKQGVPLVTFNKDPEVFEVLEKVAFEKAAPITLTQAIEPLADKLFSQRFKYRDETIEIHSGAHYQRLNAALAYEALKLIQVEASALDDAHILQGLSQAKWPGRFDAISKDPLVVVDGAHNAAGIEALVENFEALPRPIVVVFAALKDKDTESMLAILDSYSNHVIVTEFEFYRAQTAKALQYQDHFEVIEDYEKAIATATSMTEFGTTVVCGSLYFISQVYNTFVVKERE